MGGAPAARAGRECGLSSGREGEEGGLNAVGVEALLEDAVDDGGVAVELVVDVLVKAVCQGV